jgi:hypothetical protein
MTQTASQASLYNRDFALWVEDVMAKLKARDFDHLDLENLIEEIEALGKSERKELKSRLSTLLAHLLKRIYIDSASDNRGWEITIREQRKELELLLEQSPSLKHYFADAFDSSFRYALAEVRQDYAKVQFPDTWQFSQDVGTLLTEQFWR